MPWSRLHSTEHNGALYSYLCMSMGRTLHDVRGLTKMRRRPLCVISVTYISTGKFTCAATVCPQARFYRWPADMAERTENTRQCLTVACTALSPEL